MQIKVGTTLDCGCCGQWFDTWKGYVDQDQDLGYGICKGCQGWIEEKEIEEIQRAINTLATGLNGTNKTKFLAMDFKKQKAIVFGAMDRGLLTWEVRAN